MRKLDPLFLQRFMTGDCKPLVDTVIKDKDLDLQIRKRYINIYFKGNSILKLWEDNKYEIHQKFVKNTSMVPSGVFSTKDYLTSLQQIKSNVTEVKSIRPTREIEYEQLIIRSNNQVNSEVFITDRQFADNKNENKTRFDLTGITWSAPRRREEIVPLTFIEVKYGLNNDIQYLHEQMQKYYDKVRDKIKEIAQETTYLLKTKTDMGLIGYNEPSALESLKIDDRIEKARFIIALIDYNPKSSLLNLSKLKDLHFSNQIKIYYCGFAIWPDYLDTL